MTVRELIGALYSMEDAGLGNSEIDLEVGGDGAIHSGGLKVLEVRPNQVVLSSEGDQ